MKPERRLTDEGKIGIGKSGEGNKTTVLRKVERIVADTWKG